jgi:hypothetical protein
LGLTGFDYRIEPIMQAQDVSLACLKLSRQKSTAKNSDELMAGSVADADAILAKFGYVEQSEVAVA